MHRFTRPLRDWGIVLPWPKAGFRGLTGRQQVGIAVRAVAQTSLLVVAARDLRQRPNEQVRGTKWLWAPVIAMNYLGIGPIVYLLGGRRRT
jgi:hypothetical protein